MANKLIAEESIDLHFEMPYSREKLFQFIILPTSMPLYTGFMLIPGIVRVDSSDNIRRIGTRDHIFNNDHSTHSSVTLDLIAPSRYVLHIDEIKAVGYKKIFSSLLLGFKEDWSMESIENNQKTKVHRRLVILHARPWWAKLLIVLFIKPQLKQSLLIHHKNICKTLK